MRWRECAIIRAVYDNSGMFSLLLTIIYKIVSVYCLLEFFTFNFRFFVLFKTRDTIFFQIIFKRESE